MTAANDHLPELAKAIEHLRQQLQLLVQDNPSRLQGDDVYRLSVKLDHLIDQFHREVENLKIKETLGTSARVLKN